MPEREFPCFTSLSGAIPDGCDPLPQAWASGFFLHGMIVSHDQTPAGRGLGDALAKLGVRPLRPKRRRSTFQPGPAGCRPKRSYAQRGKCDRSRLLSGRMSVTPNVCVLVRRTLLPTRFRHQVEHIELPFVSTQLSPPPLDGEASTCLWSWLMFFACIQ